MAQPDERLKWEPGYRLDPLNRWTEDPDRSLGEAQRLGDRMVELELENAGGKGVLALTAMVGRNFDRLRRETAIVKVLTRMLELSAICRAPLPGQWDATEANAHIERCMRLNPSLSATMFYL